MGFYDFIIKVRRNRRNLLLLLALVVILDLVLRISFPDRVLSYFYTNDPSGWKEDPELFWMEKTGFANQFETARQTPGDKLIYCFGGSIVKGDFAATNFCEELDGLLPPEYEVVNFALSGYTSYQSLVLFNRAINRKVPALNIVSNGFNDMGNAAFTDREMAIRNQRFSTHVLYFLSKSRIVGLMRLAYQKWSGWDPYDGKTPANYVQRVDKTQFFDNLRTIANTAKENGSAVLLISQAFPDQSIQEVIDPYFDAMTLISEEFQNSYYLDIRSDMISLMENRFGAVPEHYNSNNKGRVYIDLCHLTDESHRFVAEKIYSFIQAHGLLDLKNSQNVQKSDS